MLKLAAAPPPRGVFDLAKFMPADPLEAIAWRDCVRFAIAEPGLLECFEQDTGVVVTSSCGVLNMLVDEATGANRHVVEAFLGWFNANVWGNHPSAEPS